MQIRLIVIGKTVKSYLKEAEAVYDKRLPHYIRYDEVVIPELKNASKMRFEDIKVKEGQELMKKIDSHDEVILLDEGGKEFTSRKFAENLERKMHSGVKRVVFVVGGAYGFSPEVYQRASTKMSLSKMTFSHQMVRTIFKEQLYRAFTILKGEPYHHD